MFLFDYSDISINKLKPPEISYINNRLSRKTTPQVIEEIVYDSKFVDYLAQDSGHNNDAYKSVNTYEQDQENINEMDGFNKNVVNDDGQSITFGPIPVDDKLADENLLEISPPSYDNGQLISFGPLAVNDEVPEESIEMIGQPYDSGQSITFGPTAIDNILLTEENIEVINPTN